MQSIKKLVETSRAVAFKNIQPIAVPATEKATLKTVTVPPVVEERLATPPPSTPVTEAKLIIETKEERPQPVVQEQKPVYQPAAPKTKGKISTLDAIRQKVSDANEGVQVIDQPLTDERLKEGWLAFIQTLKDTKNPAWQSFEVAELKVKDANSFEAVVTNNINQKFLELERNKASDFLKEKLHNRLLQLQIVLIESEQEVIVENAPLSSKQQYQLLIEKYPLVKELRERLKMDLDF